MTQERVVCQHSGCPLFGRHVGDCPTPANTGRVNTAEPMSDVTLKQLYEGPVRELLEHTPERWTP